MAFIREATNLLNVHLFLINTSPQLELFNNIVSNKLPTHGIFLTATINYNYDKPYQVIKVGF